MKTLTILTVLIITLCAALLVTCAKDTSTAHASLTWTAYVKAVRDGDTATARSFLAVESRPYLWIDSSGRDDYIQSTFTVTKSENHGDYVKLHILKERSGHQYATFRYAVHRDTAWKLQYPFLIFAKDWPTHTSEHFVVHSPGVALLDFTNLEGSAPDTPNIDINALESFYTRVNNLTGAHYSGRFDYYYCRDFEECQRLAGNGTGRLAQTPACIITGKIDYGAIADRMQARISEKPIYLLYDGLLGFAESQTHPSDSSFIRAVKRRVAEHVQHLQTASLSTLAAYDPYHGDRSNSENCFFVGGALVDLLLEDSDDNTFRALYQNSPTPEQFEQQLRLLYNTNIETLQKRLFAAYEPYFPNNLQSTTNEK